MIGVFFVAVVVSLCIVFQEAQHILSITHKKHHVDIIPKT